MAGLLFALAALLPLALLGGLLDNDDDDATETQETSGDTDIIVSEEIHSEISDFLTPEQEAEVSFQSGAMNVDTKGGDDLIIGSSYDDVLVGGTGDDIILGRAGDDQISLGDGDDISIPSSNTDGSFGDLDDGNDSIRGGRGNDAIIDNTGANTLWGNQGDDYLETVDTEDTVTPDIIYGGWGADTIVADEADTITTGGGDDDVYIYVNTLTADSDTATATITDFEQGHDTLWLADEEQDLEAGDITVADFTDGTGATVSINGIAVVNVTGGQGMTAADVHIWAPTA